MLSIAKHCSELLRIAQNCSVLLRIAKHCSASLSIAHHCRNMPCSYLLLTRLFNGMSKNTLKMWSDIKCLLVYTGCKEKNGPPPYPFYLFYTNILAILNILTVTVYFNLTPNNLLLIWYVRNFKNFLGKWSKWGKCIGQGCHFFFAPCTNSTSHHEIP